MLARQRLSTPIVAGTRMQMMANVRWLLPLVGGAAGGLLSTWVLGHTSQAPIRSAPQAPTPEPNGVAYGERPIDVAAGREAAFARALRVLSEPPDPLRQQSVPTAVPHETSDERAQRIAREAEAQVVRLERHRLETRDLSWAPAMEEVLDNAVRQFSGSVRGNYEGSDCRSESCVARFSWSSREEARSELRATMERVGPVPCATAFVLPPDDTNSGAPYEASIYMDCQASRSGMMDAGL